MTHVSNLGGPLPFFVTCTLRSKINTFTNKSYVVCCQVLPNLVMFSG